MIYNADSDGAVLSTTRRQAEYLSSRGHHVTVLSNSPPNWNGVWSKKLANYQSRTSRLFDFLANGIGRRLPPRLSALDFRGIIPFVNVGTDAAHEIGSLLKQGICDRVIVCQHPCFLGLRNLVTQVPIVLVAHGDAFSHPWRSFPIPLMMMYRLAAVSAYRNAALVITVSRCLRKRALKYRSESLVTTVIPNGISASEIGIKEGEATGQVFKSSGRPLKILFIGRLAREKGIDVLLNAMKLLPAGIQLDLVGGGPLRSELEALVVRNQLDERVKFHGSVGRCELALFYRNADIVCVPSRSEAQGVVILEAMIAGRAVVASDVGGIPDCIQDGVTGILVPPENARALSDVLQKLADDAELRFSMGRCAEQKAREFAWPLLLARFEESVLGA